MVNARLHLHEWVRTDTHRHWRIAVSPLSTVTGYKLQLRAQLQLSTSLRYIRFTVVLQSIGFYVP